MGTGRGAVPVPIPLSAICRLSGVPLPRDTEPTESDHAGVSLPVAARYRRTSRRSSRRVGRSWCHATSVTEDNHPADKAIGSDWHEPGHARKMQAWNKLTKTRRERLTELQRQGWEENVRLDQLEGDDETHAWVEYELIPVPPRDTSPPERIARWPVKVEFDECGRARAIREEHGI